MFRIPGTCSSHHRRITAMNVCDSRFDKLWHGAKSSHSLFSISSCGAIRCKNGLPQSYLSCFQNLYLTFGAKAESNVAYSFEDCCKKLDIQKGGGPKGSPTIVKTCKNNALRSASSKFRSLCVNMTLPWWKK